MKRADAIKLLNEWIKNDKLLKHCIAVEAIMRAIAKELGDNEEKYALLGLLHDIDYEKTVTDPKRHGIMAEEILKDKVSDEILRAIKSHNYEHTGLVPKTKLEISLLVSDALSGLIIACALIMPNKKLAEVKIKTIKRKFKQKDFARGCSRERILFCEKLGMEKEKFFEIALEALKGIASELGL